MLKIAEIFFYVLITFLCEIVKCDIKSDVNNRVKELEERSKRLYGDTHRRSIKQWQLNTEDAFSYPKGDEQKLAAISQVWINYYRCISHVVNSMTPSGRFPSVNVAVYEGDVARLPCGLCVAPGESDCVSWFYAESHNVTFTPLKEKSSMILDVNVSIYNVELRHAGLYRCQLGDSISAPVVLEVFHDQEYQVMDSEVHHPDVDIKTTLTSTLSTFISWSLWSECSACDRVGKRRRYGMCYVRLNNGKLLTTAKSNSTIFQDFPNGIACRSWLLPAVHHNDHTITDRKNVIVTESCKCSCKEVFEVRSKSGELIERAINSDGVFSLSQSLPPQPPPPGREILFAKYGERVTLKCPGTTLRHIPITWRKGTNLIVEIPGDETLGGVHVNARNQIVFTSVEDSHINVYSCWQSAVLAGVVKLEVWQDARTANNRLGVVICLTVLAVGLHYAVRVFHSKLRHAL